MAGTPCPYEGAIGKEAATKWEDNPHERPDFKEYEDKMELRDEAAALVLVLASRTGKDKKNAWIKACKKTKHLVGKHQGITKSGRTCRNEWKELDTTSTS